MSFKKSWVSLLLLVLAGEAVFILPFVLSRVFRPTVLEVFNLSNVELGICFSVYGVVAMLSYLLGGPLADKFAPRKLIAFALWLTALGGLVYAGFPNYFTLKILYAYWGFTTIFLCWAPMIKATRILGGELNQGKAFGFLDGGRGLVAALFGALGVLVFSWYSTKKIVENVSLNHQSAFKNVILTSTAIVFIIGVLVWFFLKLKEEKEITTTLEKISFKQIKPLLKISSVWLLMLIVLCAYVGYKITDIFSLYAQDVLLYNAVESAQVGTFLLILRPVIGVLVGFMADKTRATYWLIGSFVVSFIGALFFALGWIIPTRISLFFISVFIVAGGVYAGRTLYFSVMKQGKIPLYLTGTAIGLISIIGFTPDVFVGPMTGYLLDNYQGITGHQYVFVTLIFFSLIGVISSWVYFVKYGEVSHK